MGATMPARLWTVIRVHDKTIHPTVASTQPTAPATMTTSVPQNPKPPMAAGAKKAKLQLYSYWISSCCHRVRLALDLKGLDYEYKAVNLGMGEQSNPEFEKINPIKYVPALVDGDVVVADSFAIILYLEDKYPENPLLPKDFKKKALNIQIASIVSSSIQPLQTLTAVTFIGGKFAPEERALWAQHYINKGFSALEKLVEGTAGKYSTGDELQMGDVFLAPQIYSAKRFEIDLSNYPTLARLHDAYMDLPAFQAALPERQPDAPSLT